MYALPYVFITHAKVRYGYGTLHYVKFLLAATVGNMEAQIFDL